MKTIAINSPEINIAPEKSAEVAKEWRQWRTLVDLNFSPELATAICGDGPALAWIMHRRDLLSTARAARI
jgi:hypothetical protein